MAGVEIITVEGGSELKDFIDLPWRIYVKYPNWVPPLKNEVRRMLDGVYRRPRRGGKIVSPRSGVPSGGRTFSGHPADGDLQGNGSFLFMEVYSQASCKIGLPLRSDRTLWEDSRS